ncbi:TIR domain-containing protein [Ensifer adhaerens]|uniref:TIR domain-containing protein n=1 Tax=Ensifer adhaerens TaxID=106592 RepID=UPI003D04AE02
MVSRNDEGLALKTKPYFTKPIAEVAKSFTEIKTVDDLAKTLEIPKGVLIFIAYTRGVSFYYREFELKKKNGGTRKISAPRGGLRIIQHKLKRILDELDRKPTCSHAYHKGRSALTNAVQHRKTRYTFGVDLVDFFGTIHFGRVSGVFQRVFGLPEQVSNVLAHICCLNGVLPQGAPSSPNISNLVAYNLDRSLLSLARKFKLTYTRYADDITFSFRMKKFPTPVGTFVDSKQTFGPSEPGVALTKAVSDAGFTINDLKTRLQFQHYRQAVTGLTVNEFPNVKRSKIKEIRKLIYLWRKFGLNTAEKYFFNVENKGDTFRDYLFGNLAYIKGIRGSEDRIVRSFCADIRKITTNTPHWIKQYAEEYQVKDIFLSHASEDKADIAKPFFDECQKLGLSVFYDAEDIQWGDSIVEKINKGLGEAKIIVPVITPSFLKKKWPLKELNTAFSQFMKDKNRIMPIVHGIENLDDYPLISDLHYKEWEDNASDLAKMVAAQLSKI